MDIKSHVYHTINKKGDIYKRTDSTYWEIKVWEKIKHGVCTEWELVKNCYELEKEFQSKRINGSDEFKFIKIVTTNGSLLGEMKYRRDLETGNWHYYERKSGKIIHMQKDKMIYVEELLEGDYENELEKLNEFSNSKLNSLNSIRIGMINGE